MAAERQPGSDWSAIRQPGSDWSAIRQPDSDRPHVTIMDVIFILFITVCHCFFEDMSFFLIEILV